MGEVHENVLRFVVCCYHPALLLSLFSFFHLGGHLTFLVVITKKTPKLNQNKDKSENKQPNQPQRNPDPLGWRGFPQAGFVFQMHLLPFFSLISLGTTEKPSLFPRDPKGPLPGAGPTLALGPTLLSSALPTPG